MAYRLVTDVQLAQAVAAVKPTVGVDWLESFVPMIEDAVEAWCGRRFSYETGVVEWPTTSDDAAILLERTPVYDIEEVRYDPSGGYGQKANTFGTGTVLTPGEDYYLLLDGQPPYAGTGASGQLVRVGRSWGYAKNWQSGLIAPARVPAGGEVKVTYSGGYELSQTPALNRVPASLSMAVARAAVLLWKTFPFVGPLQSESGKYYSYSLQSTLDLQNPMFSGLLPALSYFKRRRTGFTGGF